MLQELLTNVDSLIECNNIWRREQEHIIEQCINMLKEYKAFDFSQPKTNDSGTNRALNETEEREIQSLQRMFLLFNTVDGSSLCDIEKYAASLRSKTNGLIDLDGSLKNRRIIRDELREFLCEIHYLMQIIQEDERSVFRQFSEIERETGCDERHLMLTRCFRCDFEGWVSSCRTHINLLHKTVEFFSGPPESPPHL